MDAHVRESQRLVEYAGLFKNALVYTVVMTNVKVIMEGHDGSVTLLLMAFVVASTLALKLEMQVGSMERTVQNNVALQSLLSLTCFMTALFSNVTVQFTSQLESKNWELCAIDFYLMLHFLNAELKRVC